MAGEREREDLRFVIIGAGMAGILSAIELRKSGYTDVTIYEKADRIGGTWRENTYPGLTCDVPSHSYTYTFEPNPDWSHRFSPGGEIQVYFERVAEKYRVVERIRFGEEVASLTWRDGRWRQDASVRARRCCCSSASASSQPASRCSSSRWRS